MTGRGCIADIQPTMLATNPRPERKEKETTSAHPPSPFPLARAVEEERQRDRRRDGAKHEKPQLGGAVSNCEHRVPRSGKMIHDTLRGDRVVSMKAGCLQSCWSASGFRRVFFTTFCARKLVRGGRRQHQREKEREGGGVLCGKTST